MNENKRFVEATRRGTTAVLALTDGGRRNVLSPGMVDALSAAFDAVEADADVRCVVLRGEGPAFCAGAELQVLEAAASGDFSGIENVYRGFLRVLESPLPTIALVDGPAVGAGLNLALACDLRVATERAVFDSRFLRLRLAPGGGHTWMLERRVGPETAAAMVLFGRRLGAVDGLAAGLVTSVHRDAEEGLRTSLALADVLAGVDRDFLEALVAQVRGVPLLDSHDAALDHERYVQRWSTTRPAFLAGVRDMRTEIEKSSHR
jgi:enoyl-CoA hydratase